MPEREEVAYFGAGPARLPNSVIYGAGQAIINFESTGLSLAEISHRSKTANNIIAEAKAALISLLEIPADYEILFMHGGGSGQFSAVVLNLVPVWVETRRRRAEQELAGDEEKILERVRKEVREDLRLDYLITGSWSLKASQEAARLLEPLGTGLVNAAVDSRKASGGKFGTIPEEETWSLTPTRAQGGPGSAFVYYCDNETVDGVEFPEFPQSLKPASENADDDRLIVADMSSNFLSRRVDVSKYAVIFGGVQKNVGITGITLVIVRKSLLGTVPPPSFLHAVGVWSPPIVFDWPVIAKNNSLYNTLPIFDIWICLQVMRSLLVTHGSRKIAGQEELSDAKAKVIYDVLDSNPKVYQVVPQLRARSRMNICFRIRGGDETSETEFLKGAEEKLLQGLTGHRSVGGVRASLYNAISMTEVEKLAAYLLDYAQQKR